MCTGNLVQWCEEGEVIQVDCTDLGMICAWDDEKGYSCVAGSAMNTCDLPPEGLCISETTLHWCEGDGVHTLECANGMFCGWNNELLYYDCIPEDAYYDNETEEPAPGTDEPDNEDLERGNNDLESEDESFVTEDEETRDEEDSGRESAPSPAASEESREQFDNEPPSTYEEEAKAQDRLPDPNGSLGSSSQPTRSLKEDMGLVPEATETPQSSGCQQGTRSHVFWFTLVFSGLLFNTRTRSRQQDFQQ